MAKPIQTNRLTIPRAVVPPAQVRTQAAKAPKKSIAQRIVSFLGISSEPVRNRPAVVRDRYQGGLPHHRAAPARLAQLAQGAQGNNRPSDYQLTQYLDNLLVTTTRTS